jgi:hypothetical protein
MAHTKHGDDIRRLKGQLGLTHQPEESKRVRVSVDHPDRSWRPHQKCPDQRMNAILDMVIERGEFFQADLREAVREAFDIPMGTATAYTSGALLGFREAGWVKCVDDGPCPYWKVIA